MKIIEKKEKKKKLLQKISLRTGRVYRHVQGSYYFLVTSALDLVNLATGNFLLYDDAPCGRVWEEVEAELVIK